MKFSSKIYSLVASVSISTVFFFLLIISYHSAVARKPPELIFSHAAHINMGIDCSQCHTRVDSSDKGTDSLLPVMDACRECHDIDEAETCGLCHSDAENPAALEPVIDYSPKFNHAAHISIGVECESCHEGISLSDSSSTVHLPLMDPCMACHDGETADRSCITCHEKPEGKYPEDHKPKEWTIDHVFEYSIDQGNSCKTCHTNEQCQRCHPDRDILTP